MGEWDNIWCIDIMFNPSFLDPCPSLTSHQVHTATLRSSPGPAPQEWGCPCSPTCPCSCTCSCSCSFPPAPQEQILTAPLLLAPPGRKSLEATTAKEAILQKTCYSWSDLWHLLPRKPGPACILPFKLDGKMRYIPPVNCTAQCTAVYCTVHYVYTCQVLFTVQTCKKRVPWVPGNPLFSDVSSNLSEFRKILIFERKNWNNMDDIIGILCMM